MVEDAEGSCHGTDDGRFEREQHYMICTQWWRIKSNKQWQVNRERRVSNKAKWYNKWERLVTWYHCQVQKGEEEGSDGGSR